MHGRLRTALASGSQVMLASSTIHSEPVVLKAVLACLVPVAAATAGAVWAAISPPAVVAEPAQHFTLAGVRVAAFAGGRLHWRTGGAVSVLDTPVPSLVARRAPLRVGRGVLLSGEHPPGKVVSAPDVSR